MTILRTVFGTYLVRFMDLNMDLILTTKFKPQSKKKPKKSVSRQSYRDMEYSMI